MSDDQFPQVEGPLPPYDPRFELGATLAASAREVRLNHPHCATFCVAGGSSCS